MVETERNLNATMDPVIGRGMCCRWEPGYRPTSGYLAWERILDLATSDALEEAGFDQTVTVRQVGDVREMELLGPDSPGEYVITIHPVERDDEGMAVEAMRQEMIRVRARILECGEMRREMEMTSG